MHPIRFALAMLLLGLTVPVARARDAFPPATPESQGMSSETLGELVATLENYLARDLMVGAELIVIRNRRTVLHETFGMRDVDDELAWELYTICNIRSMSKPITGAAAQILVDRGQLRLEDRVADYLPAYDTDTHRAITVEHLMTHRSGLPLSLVERAIDEYPDLQTQAESGAGRDLRFDPGDDFWYSDAGTDVLAAVIEVVSGMTIDAFVTREIFEPLAMTDTLYALDAPDELSDRIASLYMGGAHSWVRVWRPADGSFYPFAWGSQTIYSTPHDYAKFLAMWIDGGRAGDDEVLSSAAVRRTLEPVSPMKSLGSDKRYRTGYSGLEVYYGRMSILHVPEGDPGAGPVIIGHSGSDGTSAWAWPERDLMILLFTQSRGGTVVMRIEDVIDRLLIHPERSAQSVEIPEAYRPYVGTYVANYGSFVNEEFEVLFRDGHLALDIPSQKIYDLAEPDDEGKWALTIAPTTSVSFETDDSGVATLLRIHKPQSQVFEVPRVGTPAADEVRTAHLIRDVDAVAPLVGRYRGGESGAVEVFVQDRELCVRLPQGITLQLRSTDDHLVWNIRQMPTMVVTFNADSSGAITSVTRTDRDVSVNMLRIPD